MRNLNDEIRVGACTARFDIITSRWMIAGHSPTSNPLKAQRHTEQQKKQAKQKAPMRGFTLSR